MTNGPESTSNPTPRPSIRLIRPSVVVLCGPAACGKSTFAARHFRPTQIISSDQARALVCDDERDQRFSEQAFALVDFLIEQRLSINRLCVVDSTALTPAARKSLLDLARRHRVPCNVFLFDIPLQTCIARDQARERSVGQPVIERQYRLFVQECDDIEREGFDQVIKVRDEDSDNLRIDVLFRPVPRAPGPAERPELSRAAFRPSRTAAGNQRGYGAPRPPAPPAPPPPAARPSSTAPQPPLSSAPPHPPASAQQQPSSQPGSSPPVGLPQQSGGDPSSSKQS